MSCYEWEKAARKFISKGVNNNKVSWNIIYPSVRDNDREVKEISNCPFCGSKLSKFGCTQ